MNFEIGSLNFRKMRIWKFEIENEALEFLKFGIWKFEIENFGL